jgi:hypothetical protein
VQGDAAIDHGAIAGVEHREQTETETETEPKSIEP